MSEVSEWLAYVVDDDDAVRESALLLLEAAGVPARGYGSSGAFLAAFDATLAGCLIFDVHMPGLSGIALLALLRGWGVNTPAIILTGRADHAVEAEAWRYGASLLNKPASDDELIGMIRAAFATRGLCSDP
ncbi:MAG: response regulator [Rhizomicrobium sp.]